MESLQHVCVNVLGGCDCKKVSIPPSIILLIRIDGVSTCLLSSLLFLPSLIFLPVLCYLIFAYFSSVLAHLAHFCSNSLITCKIGGALS